MKVHKSHIEDVYKTHTNSEKAAHGTRLKKIDFDTRKFSVSAPLQNGCYQKGREGNMVRADNPSCYQMGREVTGGLIIQVSIKKEEKCCGGLIIQLHTPAHTQPHTC